jgi:uncharacterized protein YjbI with pentapeptide repeats
MRVSLSRSRWAAIGAAVAVSLGAGGISLVGAVSPPPPANPVTTLISPCRLMDTRAGGSNVGPRSTPIGVGEVYTATVWGTNGNCAIPTTATGIVTNVTIVGPNAGSFLTVWPADKTQPTASNLNWVAGQAPTANQITTALSVADGKIKLFNLAGSVNVIIDITGYLTPADLSNYYTKAQVDAANATQNVTVSSLQATVSSLQANTYTKAQVDTAVSSAASCKGFPHKGIDWHGCNLTGAYLANADLSTGVFTGTTFTGAQFASANATGANFSFAYLDTAYLANAYFTNASFSGATITNTFLDHSTLNGANLSFANLTASNLGFSTFVGANLTSANLTNVFMNNSTDLTNADLTGAVVVGSSWVNAIYSNTICPDGTNSNAHSNNCVGHL